MDTQTLDAAFKEALETYKRKKVLEELGIVKKKPKFAARLVRGLAYGAMLGPLLGMLFAGAGMYAQAINPNTVYTPSLLGTFGLVAGLAGSVTLEISKDMEG